MSCSSKTPEQRRTKRNRLPRPQNQIRKDRPVRWILLLLPECSQLAQFIMPQRKSPRRTGGQRQQPKLQPDRFRQILIINKLPNRMADFMCRVFPDLPGRSRGKILQLLHLSDLPGLLPENHPEKRLPVLTKQKQPERNRVPVPAPEQDLYPDLRPQRKKRPAKPGRSAGR